MSFNWKEKRLKKAFLALENGEVFKGYSFGASVDKLGETVFNTGMSGYEGIISDPSYAGQFVSLTVPEIGNYGIDLNFLESRSLFLNGLIVCDINEPSNYSSQISLQDMLKKHNIPAIAGIDVRRLTLMIREQGSLKGFLHCSDENITIKEAVAKAKAWEGLDNQDYASRVTAGEVFKWNEEGTYKVVAYDFGVKYNILRSLAAHDMQITVVPAGYDVAKVMEMKPDGVFLSNGPADPSSLHYAIDAAKYFTGKVPLMGICLGHQIMGISAGCSCYRLKFGHHGLNHPVKNLITNQVEITSQNHNFALDIKNIPSNLEITHINMNDNTLEGIRHKTEPFFSVQYHPEAAPGPNDSLYLFETFRKMMER